jgi:hypothetical protein
MASPEPSRLRGIPNGGRFRFRSKAWWRTTVLLMAFSQKRRVGALVLGRCPRLRCACPSGKRPTPVGDRLLFTTHQSLYRYRASRFADSMQTGEAVEDDGSTLAPRPSPLATRYSLLATRYSLLATRYSR